MAVDEMTEAVDARAACAHDLPVLERELRLATPAHHRECIAQQAEGRIAYLIAWYEGLPVGHGLIHWPGPRDPVIARQLEECPEIFMLGVRDDLRGRGIGGLLVARLEQLATDRGKSRIGLGVALTNVAARRLYERLGYRDARAPHYVDRWHSIDATGRDQVHEDRCVFLVKPLAAR